MVSNYFRQLKILAVDDDLMVLSLMGRCLAIYGATPILCDNPRDAIREVKNCRPDVILLDLMMPGRDGYAFLRDLRELKPGCGGDTPVVIVTGAVDPEVEGAVREAGAGYLSKPFTPIVLFNAIIQALNESVRLQASGEGLAAVAEVVR